MKPTDRELDRLARALGEALRGRGARVACAESCTGGWISKTLTDVPGSSAWFGWGFVTYADDAKRDALGVPQAVLSAHGAVSEAVVAAMAERARTRAAAEFSVAVSGVAGPGGGTRDKPVGTVCFAWCGPGGARTERCRFDGDREAVRRQSVARALEGLLTLVGGDG